VTGWLALQPDLQVIVDPGGLEEHGDAVVIGLRTEIAF
jgi:carbohydrate-selective porin OprB